MVSNYHVTHCIVDLSCEHRWGLIDNHYDFFWYLDAPSNLLELSISNDFQSIFLSYYKGGVSPGHVMIFPVQ